MSPYDVLGVAKDAAADVIKAAYRKLSRKYHPDVSSEPDREQKMRDINEAWAILGDEPRRIQYDTNGGSQPISSIEHDAMDWVARQFTAAVDANVDQMVEKVTAAMHQNVANLHLGIVNCRLRIAHLEKQAKRIAHRSGQQSLVHTLIENKKKDHLRGIENMTRGLEILVRVGELLAEYSDVADPEQPAQSTTNTITISYSYKAVSG